MSSNAYEAEEAPDDQPVLIGSVKAGGTLNTIELTPSLIEALRDGLEVVLEEAKSFPEPSLTDEQIKVAECSLINDGDYHKGVLFGVKFIIQVSRLPREVSN